MRLNSILLVLLVVLGGGRASAGEQERALCDQVQSIGLGSVNRIQERLAAAKANLENS